MTRLIVPKERAIQISIARGNYSHHQVENFYLDVIDLLPRVADLFTRLLGDVSQSDFYFRGVDLPRDLRIANLSELHFSAEQIEKGRPVDGQLARQLPSRFQLVNLIGYVEIHGALIAARLILLRVAAALRLVQQRRYLQHLFHRVTVRLIQLLGVQLYICLQRLERTELHASHQQFLSTIGLSFQHFTYYKIS